MFRVGIGQDSHKFVLDNDQKPLMMGGILIPDQLGLEGNSDSDPLLHALFNALSSAVGKESLGTVADPMCKDQGIKDSTKYLEVALGWISEVNFKVNNISFSIEAKKPRFFSELTQKIRGNIAKLCGVTPECVGITATSGENLTAFAGVRQFKFFVLCL